MLKMHKVRLHHVITVYNDMFDHMDGVMQAFAKKKTHWKEDLFFAMKLARQKLFKYYAEVTPRMGRLPVSAHILDPFRKLRSFRMWNKGMEINSNDEIFFTSQYEDAFLKYVENEYCAKYQCLPVNKFESLPRSNLIPSAVVSRSGQSSFDSYDLSRDDEEYLMPSKFAETTPGRSDRAAR